VFFYDSAKGVRRLQGTEAMAYVEGYPGSKIKGLALRRRVFPVLVFAAVLGLVFYFSEGRQMDVRTAAAVVAVVALFLVGGFIKANPMVWKAMFNRSEFERLLRLERLVADGALIASAAGSTSYARAMGAAPLPMNTPALLLVGSNVLRPEVFRPAILPLEAEVELRTLDPDKRPLKGFIDGVPQGEVRALRARISRIAGVELAFAPEHDAAEKLARVQFPLKA